VGFTDATLAPILGIKHLENQHTMTGSNEDGANNSSVTGQLVQLANAVPIYQDALQPMMQETGKALSVLGRTVNVALAPIRGLVWGAEKVEEWVATSVSERLKGVDPAKIVTPDLAIAGPTIEALKYHGHKAELSSMFAGVLAGAMRIDLKEKVHPSFVEKIRLMTILDAKVFQLIASRRVYPTIDISQVVEGFAGKTTFSKFLNPQFIEVGLSLDIPKSEVLGLVQGCIEHLDDLGLINAKVGSQLTAEINLKMYEEIIEGEICSHFRSLDVVGQTTYTFDKSLVELTKLGEHFHDVTSES
jgi:hypothetical protein